MSERMTMTRRALMNTAAAAGAAGMLDGIAQAQAQTGYTRSYTQPDGKWW